MLGFNFSYSPYPNPADQLLSEQRHKCPAAFIALGILPIDNETSEMSDKIKHIVMWKLKGNNDTERLQAVEVIKNSFESLRGQIPGMTLLEIGVDFSRIEYACDVVLYSEFESKDALNGYATHPEHARVKQEVADLRITRHQVDYLAGDFSAI